MWDLNKYADNIVAVDDHGVILTYAELKKQCDIVSSKIDDRCLVFSLCNNEIGSLIGYVSFINNKIVPLLLSSHIDDELLNNLVNNYHPSYLWVPDTVLNKFSDFTSIYNTYGYTLLKTNFDKKYDLFEELCLLLTTSGSTGSPKLVRQSYRNVKSNAESIVEYLNLDNNERPITTLPMNYTYGLSIINSHLLVGATLLLTDKGLMQKEFWSFFKDQKATSFGGVPYTYEMLDRLRFFRMDLLSLRYMTQAGGKLTPDLHKKFAEYADEHDKKFIVMYGQCEATARMGYLPYDKSLEKCGSMGIAIPGGEFCLVDVDGQEIHEPNITGELVYKGDNVTLGYANSGNDLVLGDERNGVLHTGDMAQYDEDGYYYIVGRKKRFLKIYGNRVNLDEIDRMLKAKFDNLEVASTGIDDHMYIFITNDKFADDIIEYVSKKTGLNSAAFNVKVIEEIPINDSGKTLYKELSKYYQ